VRPALVVNQQNYGAGPSHRIVYPGPTRGRIYAGQPDPKDPSHFTICYVVDGQPCILDGRLDDNDAVTLTRHGEP